MAKRSWLLIGIGFILLLGIVLAVTYCISYQNRSVEQNDTLNLTPAEYNVLDTAIREYLYEKCPILRDTEFSIGYKRVATIWPRVLIIDAYASFKIPPLVVRAAFFNGHVKIISEEDFTEEDFIN